MVRVVLISVFLNAFATTRGMALVTNNPADKAEESLYLSSSGEEVENKIILAPQLQKKQFGLTAGPGETGLGETGSSKIDNLIFNKECDAKCVLSHLAPGLSQLSLREDKADFSVETSASHRQFSFFWGNYRVYGAYLKLHWLQNKLVMIQASLPNLSGKGQEKFTASDFSPLDKIWLNLSSEDRIFSREKVIFVTPGDSVHPSWLVNWYDSFRETYEELLIDAKTGETIRSQSTVFDMASVYRKGPQDSLLISVDLPELDGSGYLDGADVSVFAPTENDFRVVSLNSDFIFDPENEQLSFDQVQSYYGATRALNWFKEYFHYKPDGQRITVRINEIIRGERNNAEYLPPEKGGPAIIVGPGDGRTLTNLGRDTDVITHELSHHIIYQFLKTSAGESGILHEGYADYFAYSLNGDPYLGETIRPGYPYLRTAQIPPDWKFDQQMKTNDPHVLGQFWSAVLWGIRENIGPDMDQMVYSSLPYLSPKSGFQDALLALLNADRDLFSLPAGDPEKDVFGVHKCEILSAALDRGFAMFLAEIDGTSCSLNLSDLANQSRLDREKLTKNNNDKGKEVSFSLAGKPCAVISGSGYDYHIGRNWWWLMLLLPLIMVGYKCIFLEKSNKIFKKGSTWN